MCIRDRKIANKVKTRISQNQKDYYIKEQIKALQEDIEDDQGEFYDDSNYYELINSSKMPDKSKEKLLKEAAKMMKMPQGSQESSIIQTYLDTCLELPWQKFSTDEIDINKAEKLLNREHYGLEKIKEQILETLSVKKLNPQNKGQIICLVGPPGTGKTLSLIHI